MTTEVSAANLMKAETRKRVMLASRPLQRTLFAIISLTLLVVLWELGLRWFHLPAYVLPSPGAVLDDLRSGLLVWPNDPRGFYIPLAATLSNAGWGFLLGAIMGLVLGSLMAELPWFEGMVMPYVYGFQSLPKVALAPLVIIWFGFGDGSKIVLAALLVFFPMMVNTFTGIRTIEPERKDLMRALSASKFETYFFLQLPAAAPYIFAGINMGIVYALLGTIVAEFLGAQKGMGVAITQAQAVADVASVFALLIVLGVVGTFLHWIVTAVEKRIVHWTERAKP